MQARYKGEIELFSYTTIREKKNYRNTKLEIHTTLSVLLVKHPNTLTVVIYRPKILYLTVNKASCTGRLHGLHLHNSSAFSVPTGVSPEDNHLRMGHVGLASSESILGS